jgi:hypothetical protein
MCSELSPVSDLSALSQALDWSVLSPASRCLALFAAWRCLEWAPLYLESALLCPGLVLLFRAGSQVCWKASDPCWALMRLAMVLVLLPDRQMRSAVRRSGHCLKL